MVMIIVWALSWWYGAGWRARLVWLREVMASSYDYFSIGQLSKTLFSPYRQIAAGKVKGPIGVKWRAFVDRSMSRVIGAVVRLLFIVVGSAWLVIQLVVGVFVIAIWALIPVAPLIGFVVMMSGWVPSWR